MSQLTQDEADDLVRRTQAVQNVVMDEAEQEGVPLAAGMAYRLAYTALREDLLNTKRSKRRSA